MFSLMHSLFWRQTGLNVDDNSVTLNIRRGPAVPLSVDINKNASVSDLKKLLLGKDETKDPDIGIIFAGRVLRDEEILDDLQLGQHSVLHALKIQPDQQHRATNKRHQYFVYCRVCKRVCPGKLRVQCSTCQDQAFVLSQEPQSLDDVLENKYLSGTCSNNSCSAKDGRFYFKCGSHDSVDDRAVVLRHIRQNFQGKECITCAEIQSPVLVFPCQLSHVMCLDCFRNYGLIRLNDRMFTFDETLGYTLPCPANCDVSCIQESHHFCLLGHEQYERYKKFGTEENVLSTGGVLCPGPNCGNGLLPEGECNKVECLRDLGGCGMVFCKHCLNDYHEGECDHRSQVETEHTDYNIDPEQAQRSRWDKESSKLISDTTKPCPKCKVKTERDGGCLHMTCSRCQFEWCWLCATEWNYECQADHWFG